MSSILNLLLQSDWHYWPLYELCHILRSHPQKSIFRKIRKSCQKLLESYPNWMLCMAAFFFVKRCQNRVQNSWSVSSYTLHARPCFPLQEVKASLFLFNAISIYLENHFISSEVSSEAQVLLTWTSVCRQLCGCCPSKLVFQSSCHSQKRKQ